MGKIIGISNSEGKRTTPSVVAFVEGGERKVGDPAKRQAITNPEKTISSIKRMMGSSFDECKKEIKKRVKTENWTFFNETFVNTSQIEIINDIFNNYNH